jgi:hypothetical protein
MIKHLTNFCLFLIPFTITYAIVSDFGKPQHHYHSPGFIGVSHQGVPQANGN